MQVKTKVKLKTSEILSLCYCVLTTIYYTLKGWVYASKLLEILLVIGIICGVINLVQFIRIRINRFIIILPIIMLTIYRMSLGADTRLIVSLLAVIIGITVDFDKIAIWILKTKIATFFCAFIVGGYMHRNYLAMNMGVIIFLILYVYYPKYKLKALSWGAVVFAFGVYISKSGAMLICVGIGLLLYMALNSKSIKKLLSSKILIFLFPLILLLNWFLVVLYAAYGYSNSDFYFIKKVIPNVWSQSVMPFLNMLNRFLTGRISLAAFSVCKFGISLWGGNIDYTVDTGLPYFLVDSGMMLLLQDWGLIMTVVVMLMLVFLMWKLVKKKEYRLIISAIVIALWAFNEDTLLSVGTNYLFYVIGHELCVARKKVQKQTKNVVCRI